MDSLVRWLVLSCCCAGCVRASAASFVPKLDLTARVARVQALASATAHQHLQVGLGAWLRWQPVIEAASVPVRAELSPAAWIAPCSDDDALCFAELAEDEREIAHALREAP